MDIKNYCLKNKIKILENSGDMWFHCIIKGRFIDAKIYNIPSDFGINSGRVSKLAIGKNAHRDRHANYFNQCDYNYDRGLDFDDMPGSELKIILDLLENLPPLYMITHD